MKYWGGAAQTLGPKVLGKKHGATKCGDAKSGGPKHGRLNRNWWASHVWGPQTMHPHVWSPHVSSPKLWGPKCGPQTVGSQHLGPNSWVQPVGFLFHEEFWENTSCYSPHVGTGGHRRAPGASLFHEELAHHFSRVFNMLSKNPISKA